MPDDMPERPSGTYIGTQNIHQSPIRVSPGNFSAGQLGKAENAFKVISDNIDLFDKLAKSTGNLTDAQTKLVKEFVKSVDTVQGTNQIWQRRADTGMGGFAEDQRWQEVMETPGFHGTLDRARQVSRNASARLGAEEFAEIFREGSRVPQPSTGELLDVLGRRGRGAAKQRQEWIDQGFFERGGVPTEGITGAAAGVFARARSMFTDESGMAISGLLWRSSMVAGMGLIPQLRAGADYQSAMADRDVSMMSSGQMNYEDVMGGTLGRIRRGAAGRQSMHLAFGNQVYNAYGSAYEATLPGLMSGPVGAAAGVLGPAAAVGAIASMTPLGPLGWGLGAAVGTFGAINYANQSAQNFMSQGALLADAPRQGALGAVLGNFEGAVGNAVTTSRYNLMRQFGGLSEEDYSRFSNRRGMASIARDWASGQPGFDTARVREMAQFAGYKDAEWMGFGVEEYLRGAEGRGISRDSAMPNLSYWMTYQNAMPTGQQTGMMDALSLAGVDLAGLTGSVAGARGISPFNRQGMANTMTSTMARVYNADNPTLMAQQIQAGSQLASSVRPYFSMAGLQMGDTRQIERLLSENPDFGFGYQEFAQQYSGLMQSNNPLARKTQGGFIGDATRGLLSGDYVGMGEAFRNWGAGMSFGSNVMNYGASMDQAAAVTNAFQGLNVSQRNLAGSILSGDRLAISRFGARTGNQRLQVLDSDTGLGAFEQNINVSEAAMLRADDPYNMLGKVSDAQLAGGERGMQNELRLQGRGQRYYNRAVDMWQRQVSAGLQQGSFFEAAQVFQRFGMELNVGTGQGYWQIEDAQRNLNRQQEAYNVQQSGQGINLQEAQFALAGQQFNEQWSHNRRQFNFQTGYQWNQMQRGFARQEVEWGWQREDMAFSRNQDEMQYGWQMEDFDRNIRFSRGRERLDLLRQRNRAVVTQSMEMMQRDRTEDRFESTVDFQKEGNRLQEAYFKENKKFQIEAQDMNKRHFEERRALERQRMDMTKEQHEKQKSWMTERWALEDQRVLLDRQNIELQRQITEEVATKTAEWQESSIALQEAMTGINTFFGDMQTEINLISSNAPKILEILQGIKNLGSLTSGNITIQVGSQSINVSQALDSVYALPQGPG